MGASSNSGYSDEDDTGLMTDINITPLVDVVLVLLIVFLMTVPSVVGSNALKVNLPESSNGTAVTASSPWELVVRKNDDGETSLYLNGELTSKAQLDEKLAELGAVRESQEIRLAGDRGVDYGEVTKVLDMLASLKLQKIALRTKPTGR